MPEAMDDLPLLEVGLQDGAALVVIKERVPKVLTASADRMAKLWSSSTGECLLTLSGHS